MKKLFLLIALNLYGGLQIGSCQQSDEIQDIFNRIFNKINKVEINTGYLFEKTIHQVPFLSFDGSQDSICLKQDNWKNIYIELFNSNVGNGKLLPIYDSVIQQVMNNYSKGINPLIIFNYDYNKIKDNAFTDQLLDTLKGEIIDNPLRVITPYESKTLFAASPAYYQFGFGEVTFKLTKEFFFSNKDTIFPEMEIDFQDGQGFKFVQWDEEIKINYSDTIPKKIIVKISKTNLVSASYYKPSGTSLIKNNSPNTRASYPIHGHGNWITSDIPYKNELLRGMYTVSFAYNSSGSRNSLITKPVLFIEGVDFGYKDYPDGLNGLGKCGAIGYVDFIYGKEVTFSGNQDWDYDLFTKGPQFIENLNQAGYDFIFLDFEKGAEYMQKNAMVLVKLIQETNNLKNGCAENIVCGASMGGQVARYALAYMEYNNIDHKTRQFVSFDSPNNGANIAIGFQQFINYFADKSQLFFADARDGRERKLNKPAARQLLVYHYSVNGPDPLRTEFLNELAALGSYPQKLRKVAIASGSGSGTGQGFASGQKLVHMNIPVVSAVTTIVASFIGTIFGGILAGIIAHYVIHDYEGYIYATQNGSANVFSGTSPFHSWTNIGGPSGMLPYDNCPGGQNDAINSRFPEKGLFKGFLVNPYAGFFSFIPTVSAIGLTGSNASNLNFNINSNYGTIVNNNLSPFNSFFTPSGNEPHVKMTTNNLNYFIAQLSENDLNLANQLPSSVGSTYNFGSPFRKNLSSVTITNKGKVQINGSYATEYGAGPIPGNNSTFDVKAPACTYVEVNSGGQLIIGNNSPNNKGILVFKSGSTLKITSNGKLIINDNSKLVFEEGSTFIYEAGAQIQLQGNNSILEIGGFLKIGDNADFSFAYSGNNGGLIRFNYPNSTNSPTYITCGTNARMSFIGSSKNDPVLELTSGNLFCPSNLSKFTVSKGGVFISANATSISVESSLSITVATITSPTPNKYLELYGQSGIIINQVDFYNVQIYAQNYIKGNSLKVSNSSFSNGNRGIVAYGKGVILSNVSFTNLGIGLYGGGLEHGSRISSCQFIDNGIGVQILGYAGASISVYQSNLDGNHKKGIEAHEVTLNIKCSSITYNSGYEQGILIGGNGMLNMSSYLKAGYNDISQNYVSIQSNYADMIQLNGGYNKLYTRSSSVGVGRIVKGTVMNPFCSSTTTSTIDYDCHKNQWKSSGFYNPQTSDNSLNSYCISGTNKTIKFIDNTPIVGNINCPVILWGDNAISSTKNPLQNCPTCSYLNSPHFSNIKLDEAVRHSLAKMDSTIIGGNKNAVELFSEIVNSNIANPSKDEQFLLGLSHRKMLESLSNAKQFAELESSNNVIPIEAEIVLNTIDNLKANNDYKKQFYLELEKVETYRLIERRDLALGQLDQLMTWSDPNDIEYVKKWKCLIEAENQVLNGQSAKEDFKFIIDNCGANQRLSLTDSETENNIYENFFPETHFQTIREFKIFPNPASEIVNIEINIEDSEWYTFSIYNLIGELLIKEKLTNGINNIKINNLKSGLYLYEVNINNNNLLSNGKINIVN